MSSTATSESVGLPARRRVALAAAVAVVTGVIVLLAAVLVPQDAGWKTAALGWAALLAGPFLAAQYLRRFVPVELRDRWAPLITIWGWMALALVWLLSRIPALVMGPAALLLVVTLLGGPFCGAWVATRRSKRAS